MKDKRINRGSFRLSDQIAGMLEEAAADLGKTKSDVISLAVFTFWQAPENFITCPGCKKRRWLREEMPFLPGELTKFECECGAKFWWDDDKGRVVKVKKA